MIILYIRFKKLIVQNTKSIREWAQLSIIIPFSTQHSLDALPISALLSWSKSSCCCISRSQSGWQIELKLFFCLTCPKAGPCQSSVRPSIWKLFVPQSTNRTDILSSSREKAITLILAWHLAKMPKEMTFEKYVWQQEFQNLSCRSNDWKLRLCTFAIVFYMGFLFLQVMNWEVLSCSLLPKGSDQVPLTKFNTYYFSKYK